MYERTHDEETRDHKNIREQLTMRKNHIFNQYKEKYEEK